MKDTTPNYYVSQGENGWAIIYFSSPVCSEKKTYAEVMEVANQFKKRNAIRGELHADYYDGNSNSWKPRSTL